MYDRFQRLNKFSNTPMISSMRFMRNFAPYSKISVMNAWMPTALEQSAQVVKEISKAMQGKGAVLTEIWNELNVPKRAQYIVRACNSVTMPVCVSMLSCFQYKQNNY